MANSTNTAVVTQSIGIGLCYHPIHLIIGPVYPYPTSGIVITGFPKESAGPNSITTTGGLVLSTCGHLGTLVTGSSTVTAGNIARCKVGSHFTGDFIGEIVTGADNHITG